MRLVPATVKAAARWVAEHHRHLRRELAGARFAVALEEDGVWRGVALATSGPRVWEGTGRCNIARVGTDGVHNGCSMLYGAMCRAAKALGYQEAWTYTLPGEPGTSLRAAGFEDMGPDPRRGARQTITATPGRRAAAAQATLASRTRPLPRAWDADEGWTVTLLHRIAHRIGWPFTGRIVSWHRGHRTFAAWRCNVCGGTFGIEETTDLYERTMLAARCRPE